MLFAIICTDKPDGADIRAKTRPEHLAYLNAHSTHIYCAGPTLSDDDTGAMNGSVLLMDFADLTQARAFAENDPYAKAGLFENVAVRPWKKVFPAD